MNGRWWILNIVEISKLFDKSCLVAVVKKSMTELVGHLVKNRQPSGRRLRRRTKRLRWLDDMEDNFRRLAVKAWKRVANLVDAQSLSNIDPAPETVLVISLLLLQSHFFSGCMYRSAILEKCTCHMNSSHKSLENHLQRVKFYFTW